ncbi:hypothetical protein [Cerasicoccus frondis]|uniref:hypothetical protein n=1 Tax=Cerasicoccus frondis TaxID=490090 RepID=UPI002852AED5|nr:hypothetical protein [Cerasicoccus frondis]
MRKAIHCTLLTLITWCQLIHAEELFREFTSTSGQTMMARPVSVVGEQIRIQREDGGEFNVNTDIFSQKDQDYLIEWRLKFLQDQGRLFKINTKEGSTKKTKTKTMTKESWDWQGYYEITLENRSDLALSNVRIEYTYFLFNEQEAATSRNDGRIEKETGEIKIKHLSPRKTVTNSTSKIPMRETELDSNAYYVNGGDDKSKDRLEGIAMKIFVGDTLVAHYADPSNILQKMR